MKLKYQIAKINISVFSELEISQSGFCSLFSGDFAESDVEISVTFGNIERSGKLIYSDERFDVLSDEKNNFTRITKDRERKIDFISTFENDGKFYCTINSQCDNSASDMFYIWNAVGLSHIMISKNRIIFHGSCVIHNGKAIIFSGKSGIGKSTQADLWEKYAGAEIINGDKIVLFTENGKLFASSLPIAGTSGICVNKTAEVEKIVFLEQSEKNYIKKLSSAQKVGLSVSNSICEPWRKDDFIKVVDLCTAFYDKTEIIGYSCRADKSAVEFLR